MKRTTKNHHRHMGKGGGRRKQRAAKDDQKKITRARISVEPAKKNNNILAEKKLSNAVEKKNPYLK